MVLLSITTFTAAKTNKNIDKRNTNNICNINDRNSIF